MTKLIGNSAAACLFCGCLAANAQTCVTQAGMDAATRSSLQSAALSIASAIKAGDTARAKSEAVTELAGNFTPTENLIRSTSEKIASDTLRVTHLYALDASARAAGETSSADFACVLKDSSASETDFSINGLPQGSFGFAMVEASGARPWLLAMLLQKQGETWKMAGLYPRALTAAGHDGLWYWKEARNQAGTKQALLAWLSYAEANNLLQPAPFVSSSNLEKLRTEQRQSGPPELVNGVSAEAPYVVHGSNGADYRFTSFMTEPSDDDRSLHLVLHVADAANATPEAIRAHSDAALRAMATAHPELKANYGLFIVFADGPQGNPPVVTATPSQLQ